jgi:hypothetical protein
MITTELSRILNNNNGELPSSGRLVFTIRADNSLLKLNLIKNVMQAVACVDKENWPTDRKWDTILPTWFLLKIKSHSNDELNKMSHLLWDYGSWLDAMKFRGWEWYSSKVDNNIITINLLPETFPYSVNPLEYVIYETGVDVRNIDFKEFP